MTKDKTIQLPVTQIKADMRVDLESCPYLKDDPSAEFEFAVVDFVQVMPNYVAIGYTSIDVVNYPLDTILTVRWKKEDKAMFGIPTMKEIRQHCKTFFKNAKFHKTVGYSKKGGLVTCHNLRGGDAYYYAIRRDGGISLQNVQKDESHRYYFYDDTVKVFVNMETGKIVA